MCAESPGFVALVVKVTLLSSLAEFCHVLFFLFACFGGVRERYVRDFTCHLLLEKIKGLQRNIYLEGRTKKKIWQYFIILIDVFVLLFLIYLLLLWLVSRKKWGWGVSRKKEGGTARGVRNRLRK